MALATPLALRWERAQCIDRSAIQALGGDLFFVPSQGGPAGYAVRVSFDREGRLASASCTCPDFQKSLPNPVTPALHGVRVCKHILAASLKAKEAGLQPVATRTSQAQPRPLASPTPAAAEPVWDAACQEWVLTDSNGLHYCGNTPNDCVRQFHEALHYIADHARKSGDNALETRSFRGVSR